MVHVWFRNFERKMGFIAEEGVSRLVFTRHSLSRQRHDGLTFLRQFYLPSGIRPHVLMIGNTSASYYRMMDAIDAPIAVWPSWSGKYDNFDKLINFCENPVGENPDICADRSIDLTERPVFGQPHKIILSNNPPGHYPWWRNIFRLQHDFPEVEFHVNGSNHFPLIFGGRFEDADVGFIDPGLQEDRIYLPGGNVIFVSDESALWNIERWSDWISMLGFDWKEVYKDRITRLRFNIRSASWAAKHHQDNFRFKMSDSLDPGGAELPEDQYVPRSSYTIVTRRKRITTKDAEKILCDRCSLAPNCKLYRAEQICGLKESEMSELGKFFQSRDANMIVDGLASITKLQADRVEKRLADEVATGMPDDQISKEINSLFANGVKLAKLVNPNLAGPGTRIQVNVGTGNNAQAVSMGNPKQMVASIILELENQGFNRADITQEMIKGALVAMTHGTPLQALTATAIATVENKDTEKLKQKIIEGTVAAEPKEPMPLLPFPV